MGKEPTNSILRTFRLEKETVNDLKTFLDKHPEVGTLNHLVNVALKEFVVIHKGDETWLKINTH